MTTTNNIATAKKVKIKKLRIDWKNVVVPKALEKWEQYVRREGHKPTFRTIYYLLLKYGIIPATTSSYGGLSEAIVSAKKTGKFPIDAFEDHGRTVIANFSQSLATTDSVISYCSGLTNTRSLFSISRFPFFLVYL
jgi:outer membrane protein assembly factor BamD (BamD/ComL family)